MVVYFRGKLMIKHQMYPIGSMYGIYANIYHQYTPNVSIYTIHGSYGYGDPWKNIKESTRATDNPQMGPGPTLIHIVETLVGECIVLNRLGLSGLFTMAIYISKHGRINHTLANIWSQLLSFKGPILCVLRYWNLFCKRCSMAKICPNPPVEAGLLWPLSFIRNTSKNDDSATSVSHKKWRFQTQYIYIYIPNLKHPSILVATASSGWWCNNHLEKMMEFVNGKDYPI